MRNPVSIRVTFLLAAGALVLAACSAGDLANFLPASGTSAVSSGAASDSEAGGATGGSTAAPTRDERIEALRQEKKRADFLSIIERGDYYFLKNEKEVALAQYEAVEEKIGHDPEVERKIARTRFELGNYVDAVKAFGYVPVRILTDAEKEIYALALLYGERTDLPTILDTLGLPKDKADYFHTMHLCLSSVHNCVVSIEDYSGSGTSMSKLKDILATYATISPDEQYRNALIAGAILQNKMYSVSGNLAEEIVSHRPDYQIALKIGGYSYYRLGRYDKARDFFHRLYELDPKNTEVGYLLGMAYYRLGDYVTSNLYLNTAVIGGYSPKTVVERQMVYNYYMIGDQKSMIKVFRYLLTEPDVRPEDFAIAIWSALSEKEISKATNWSRNGVEKFPLDATLHAMRARTDWIKGDRDAAREALSEAFRINRRLPLAFLVRGEMLRDEGDVEGARSAFESVKTYDRANVFSGLAKAALEELDKKMSTMSTSGTTMSGNTASGSDNPTRQPASAASGNSQSS